MKMVWMKRTMVTMVMSIKCCSVLYWISLLLPITEAVQGGMLVFPSQISQWKGKVEQVRHILVDGELNKIYFAATNGIYRMSSDLKSDVEEIQWSPSNASKIICRKREKEKNCENYITIFEYDLNKNIFVCGTNALKPACITLDRRAFKKPDDVISGYRQNSPRTPDGTVVSLFLDPYLFIGTRANHEKGKLLKLKPYEKDILATTKESKIFDGFLPDFISAHAYDNYAYFFLQEDGYESKKREVRYSRIARVCKHDSGVPNFQINNFITLLKTRIQCNLKTAGLTDLFYDHLQSTFELIQTNPALSKNENTYIYGLFSIANGLSLGSAICRYRVKDIQDVFSNSDLYKREQNGQMSKIPFSTLRTKITRSKCNSTTININMQELSELGGIGPQLLYTDVKPYDEQAVLSLPAVSLTTIVADEVKAKDGSINVVIFAGSIDGLVYKMVIGKDGKGRTLGKPFQPFQSVGPITSLKKLNNVVYVGGADGVASIPMDLCNAYETSHCGDCIRDPYCHWSGTDHACVNASRVQISDVESEIKRVCPKVTEAATSTATSSTSTSTSTAQVTTTIRETTISTEASTVPSTTTNRRPSNNGTTASIASVTVSTRAPTKKKTDVITNTDIVTAEPSAKDEKKSYFTEFIIMTILFVCIVLLLTILIVKILPARGDTTDGLVAGETSHGCSKLCPTFSKYNIINRPLNNHTNTKLMKEKKNLIKNTTVEMNDVEKLRPNVKVT